LTGEPITADSPSAESIAASLLDSEQVGPFLRDVLNLKIKFLEMMDDDFNTAGATAVLHQLAGEINSFIERLDLEHTRADEPIKAVAAATATLRNLGALLGLMRQNPATKKDDTLTNDLMKLLITLRQDARRDKNFALADHIRKGLTAIGVTLEDRADGTVWRKDQ
jgi:cysteinyl-tRNA synthetase